MPRYRWTIQQLKEMSNKRLLHHLIMERQSDCSNPYSPLHERLGQLDRWLETNVKEDEK